MVRSQEGFHRLLKCKSRMIRTYRNAHRSSRFHDFQFLRRDGRTTQATVLRFVAMAYDGKEFRITTLI